MRAVCAQTDQPAQARAASRGERYLSCPYWGAVLNPTSRESRRIGIAEISSSVLNSAEMSNEFKTTGRVQQCETNKHSMIVPYKAKLRRKINKHSTCQLQRFMTQPLLQHEMLFVSSVIRTLCFTAAPTNIKKVAKTAN